MPLPKPTVLPPDFHSFTLPPAALDGFNIGPSGFEWARQEMNAVVPARPAHAAWPSDSAAEPFPSLLALHRTAERERHGEDGVVRIVVAGARAEQAAELEAVPAIDVLDVHVAFEVLNLCDASASPTACEGSGAQAPADVIGLYPEGPSGGL